MDRVRAAAVYARISRDEEGLREGVQRQLEDCRRLAANLGWVVGEEYVDNDVSAYSRKPRPGYERMVADLRDGVRDAVVIYSVDRLTRRPAVLEAFLLVTETPRVIPVRFVVGDADPTTADGRMMIRTQAVQAAYESDVKSRRVQRKHQQLAEQGKPNGGSIRPFGYERDRVTIRPQEADVVRSVVARYLAGESLRSLAEWLNEAGVSTSTGSPWLSTTLRAMLRSGRIAGLREHRGVVVAQAAWEPIITPEERERVLARMAERAATGRRTPQRYALSGMLRCGKCGVTLYSSRRKSSRRYVCLSGPDHGGCGRLTVVADPVERLIADAVIYRLDTPELADALAGRVSHDQDAAAAATTIAEQRAWLDEWITTCALNRVPPREVLAGRRAAEQAIAKAERVLATATRSDALSGLIGQGAALREQWQGLNIDRQHAIIRAVLDHAVIAPGVSGVRYLNPARVQPVWRL